MTVSDINRAAIGPHTLRLARSFKWMNASSTDVLSCAWRIIDGRVVCRAELLWDIDMVGGRHLYKTCETHMAHHKNNNRIIWKREEHDDNVEKQVSGHPHSSPDKPPISSLLASISPNRT